MFLRLLFALCLFTLPLFAQEAPTQPSGAITVDQVGGSDAAIQSRIEAIVGALDGYGDVQVTVREGIVTFYGEVLDADDTDRLQDIAARVEGVVAIENEVVENTEVVQRLDPVVERFRARLKQLVDYLPLLGVAVVAGLMVMAAGWTLAKWEAPWRRIAPNAFIADIYRTILRLAFVLAGVVVALDILNATAVLTGLLGAAGIVGLAVGFAVRDTVENFIASIMLSLRQPFRPNDFVEIEGNMGSVIRLTSRATILLDPDGNHIRLPNALVFKARILNYTRNDERRFGFVLGIDPNHDVTEAKRLGLAVLRDLDFTLSAPPPQVWIKDIGASTIDIEFFAWLDQTQANFMLARSEAIRMVMAALTEAGIGMPEPTYRLKMLASDAPSVEEAPKPPAPPRPEPAALDEIAPDTTVDEMIDEERREKGEDDLLSTAIPEE